jgi:hypothetical protein
MFFVLQSSHVAQLSLYPSMPNDVMETKVA